MALQQWLVILHRAGVDLTQYGLRENELLRDEENPMVRDVKRIYFASTIFTEEVTWIGESRLYGFKVGPMPADWECYWSEPTDEFAGEFWDMVEDPTRDMPGAWCE
ncbi:hypothetical protein F4808DRAFT_458886 [Astrocystis sublimbata]|nr:hypothetical protein F4808DRAFT_458886 [Astrocystis sublimbata]